MDADGVDTNDPTPASRLHTGQHGLAAEKSGFHRVVDLLLPGGPGRSTETRARQWRSIVVDQDVYLAKGALGPLHHGVDLRRIADVRLDEHCLAALLLQLVQHVLRVPFIVHLIQHHPRSGAREYAGDASSSPAYGAGDERYFAL